MSISLRIQNSEMGRFISKHSSDIQCIAKAVTPIALLILGCVGLHYSLIDGSSLSSWRGGLEYGVSIATILGGFVAARIAMKELFPFPEEVEEEALKSDLRVNQVVSTPIIHLEEQ